MAWVEYLTLVFVLMVALQIDLFYVNQHSKTRFSYTGSTWIFTVISEKRYCTATIIHIIFHGVKLVSRLVFKWTSTKCYKINTVAHSHIHHIWFLEHFARPKMASENIGIDSLPVSGRIIVVVHSFIRCTRYPKRRAPYSFPFKKE